MSLYNILHGQSEVVPFIMAVLKKEPLDFGRFRDAWIENGTFAIYTRNGGGNREYYMPADIEEWDGYISDKDDDFDNTYATIYFEIPDRYKDFFSMFDSDKSGDDRWQEYFESMKKPDYVPPPEIKELFEQINNTIMEVKDGASS